MGTDRLFYTAWAFLSDEEREIARRHGVYRSLYTDRTRRRGWPILAALRTRPGQGGDEKAARGLSPQERKAWTDKVNRLIVETGLTYGKVVSLLHQRKTEAEIMAMRDKI